MTDIDKDGTTVLGVTDAPAVQSSVNTVHSAPRVAAASSHGGDVTLARRNSIPA